ncbi:MAG TPA: hypothetical protein VFY40_04025 [Blastocatellia bacterium]|nr:hypothetical protein [Blastocatellia bacterium]
MPRKSPKRSKSKKTAEATPEVQTPAPAKTKPTPISINRPDQLSPQEKQRRAEFYNDMAEIEGSIWRSIYD